MSKARVLSQLSFSLASDASVPSTNLANSGVTAGTYGSASQVPILAIDSKGRITSASATSVAGVSSLGYNTSTNVLTVNTADGGAYTATISPPSTQYDRQSYTATANQTTFSVAYDVINSKPLVQVYINGVLIDSSEYTATSKTSIVLTTGASSGDIVECIGYKNVSIAVASSGSSGSSSAYSNQYSISGTTTNNVEKEIFVGAVSNSRIPVALNTSVFYTADILCKRTDTSGDYASFHIKGTATNVGGTVSNVGNIYEVVVARTDANLLADLRADNINKSIGVYVTGVSGKTFSWKCVINTVEI